MTAHALAHGGYIRPAEISTVDGLVPAELTEVGHAALDITSVARAS
jgi:hypothetical protein